LTLESDILNEILHSKAYVYEAKTPYQDREQWLEINTFDEKKRIKN